MADEEKVALLIEAILSNESVKKFIDDSRKAGEAAGQALGDGGKKGGSEGAAGIKDQTAALQEMKGMVQETILEYMSWAEAGKFLWESFKEAAAVEANLAKLDSAMRTFTGATDKQIEATHAYIDAQELAYAVDDSKIIPALQTLITTTGDAASAQYLMNIALDAGKATSTDMSAATNDLTRYMISGKPGRDDFGKQLAKIEKGHMDIKDATERHIVVIKEMATKMHESASKIDTTSEALDRQKIRWDNTKEAVGAQLLQFRDGLIPVFRAVAIGIAMIIEGWANLGAVVTAAAEHFVDVGRAIDELAHGNFKAAFEEMKTAGEGWANDLDRMAGKNHEAVEKVKKSWDEQAKAVVLSTAEQIAAEKALADFLKSLEKPGGGGGGGNKKEKEKKTEQYGPDLKGWQEYQNQKLEIAHTALRALELDEKEETKRYIALLKDRLKDVNLDDKERVKLEKQVVDETIKLHKMEKDDYIKDAKAKEAAEKHLDSFIQKSNKDIYNEKVKQIKDYMKLWSKDLEIQKKGEKALAALKRDLKKQEVKQALDVASSVVGLAQTVFGDSKEAAIAGAIINTIKGYMETIGQEGLAGVASGIIVLATGAAEVAKIASTDYTKESGFDDPTNDMIAELGGHRWAKDFTNRWGAGVNKGMGDEFGGGGGSQATYNYHQYQPGQVNRQTHVHIGAVPMVDTGKDHSMRELASVVRTYINLDAERDQK